MLFRFRICSNENEADSAQGWVLAASEDRARSILGANAFLQVMPAIPLPDVPDDTVFVTEGEL